MLGLLYLLFYHVAYNFVLLLFVVVSVLSAKKKIAWAWYIGGAVLELIIVSGDQIYASAVGNSFSPLWISYFVILILSAVIIRNKRRSYNEENSKPIFNRQDVNIAQWGYDKQTPIATSNIQGYLSYLRTQDGEKINWVHEDEVSSHLHFGFIPVVKKELKLRANASEATRKAYEEAVAAGKTVIERVDANSVINRNHLQGWHGWLSNWMKQELGYDPGVYTGVTQFLGGNVSVKQLKKTGPNWREQRNQKVDAFHNARRAAAEGGVSSLDDRIILADPRTDKLQTGEKMLSFDELVADAMERSDQTRSNRKKR